MKFLGRFDVITVLLLLIAGLALALGDGRLFRKQDLPATWKRFDIPESGVTVRFPGGAESETDLSLYLIDPGGPGAADRTAHVRRFQQDVGTIRGWSATDGDTRYGIRVHLPAPQFAEPARVQMNVLFQTKEKVGADVTNFPIIEERKAVPTDKESLIGRMILAERPGGGRLAVYLFQVNGRMVFLFAEGPAVTLDDTTVRLFFRSVVIDNPQE